MMTQAQPQAAARPAGQPQATPGTGDAARAAYPAQVERALAYAAENRYAYGPKYSKLDLAYQVTGAAPRPSGVVRVSLEFRPPKSFRGKPGTEYVDVAPDGSVAARRFTHVPREDLPWVLITLAVVSLAAAGPLLWLILFHEGGNPLYVAGRVLYIRAAEPQSVPFIQFTGPDVNGTVHNWAIKPEGTGTELAFIKATLINAQSGSVKVIIDEEAAELRTGDDLTHKPIDAIGRTYQTETADPRLAVSGFLPLWSPAGRDGATREAVTLDAGQQVEGYLVFEVPAGSTFKEFRWKATDSAVVRFGG